MKLRELQAFIFEHCVYPTHRQESRHDYAIHDLGDLYSYNQTVENDKNRGQLFSIGGFLGELILCFTTLEDYTLSMPNATEKPPITPEQFEGFLGYILSQDSGRVNLIVNNDWQTPEEQEMHKPFS